MRILHMMGEKSRCTKCGQVYEAKSDAVWTGDALIWENPIRLILYGEVTNCQDPLASIYEVHEE